MKEVFAEQPPTISIYCIIGSKVLLIKIYQKKLRKLGTDDILFLSQFIWGKVRPPLGLI